MKFSSLLCQKALIANLRSTTRDEAVAEMVQALADAGAIDADKVAEVTKAILNRERQGTTGVGKGVAVPHARHEAVHEVVATIGRCKAGMDFSSLDRAPVYLVFLLLSPPDKPDAHLQAMEKIFRQVNKDQFRSFLRQAETEDAMWDLFLEEERQKLP